ncbi:MAG: hypothetical protein Barrevirus8_14 [Barrevirus sp.]|uniref:Uncharacterized protein n=1 Tax=Barrevirus sp. TaxID=2487763 RepID=A0A3G4ZQ48_9VIRU|nr:MAG: hypothetical protein Barrevirus8_14 [Barrevirus sp.]
MDSYYCLNIFGCLSNPSRFVEVDNLVKEEEDKNIVTKPIFMKDLKDIDNNENSFMVKNNKIYIDNNFID